jgi:ribonuclease Z
MKHRIPCYGYKITESPKPPRLKSPPKPEDMSLADFAILRSGRSVLNDKQQVRYAFEDWMVSAPIPCSYAYCSDTIYDTELLPYISGVNVLYHESTFLEELSGRAKETFHSTAAQAAWQAKEAGVETLVIGHYSSRYKEVEAFREEASAVFPNTLLAYDGLQITVGDGK